jgi:hypothetical protein
MEKVNGYQVWAIRLGCVAVVLLLFGGAVLADPVCYACTSGCFQQGAQYGYGYKDSNGNVVMVGGLGFPACNPGTQCQKDVQALCTQWCNQCIANGPPPENISCTDDRCSIPTGTTKDGTQKTSVCSDICVCTTNTFCRDTKIANDGIVSTQNYACKCPN